MDFSTSANFDTYLLLRDLMWSGKFRTPKSSRILLVTSVPRCTGSHEKSLGMKHLQFPDMGPSGRPPDGARLVHHKTDVLLI